MGDAAMQAISSGFSAVYRREFPFVWAAARRLGVHPAALDDAVQDVFLTAYRRWDDLDYEVSPRAWLYGVTRRVAFRYRRTEARTARRRSAVSRASRSRHEPHAELEGAHDVDAVLSGLEAGRREVFVMSELLDMSGPEIAAELKIPLNTVYSRLRLARRQLERAVTREGTGAWIHATRREQRPPRGQAQRSWALLVPMLPAGITAAAVGTAVTSKFVGIGAAVAVVGAIALTGFLGGGSKPAPASVVVAVEGDEARISRSVPRSGASAPGGAEARSEVVEPAVPPGEQAAAAKPRVPSAAAKPAPRAGPAAASAVSGSPAAPASPLPAPAAETPTPASEASTLAAEVAVLDRATAALRTGQAARALQWLAEHEQRFPAGRLVDVRKATRVRVLCRLGREAQAEAEAAALRREHPGSAVAQQVPRKCESA